MSRSRRHTPIMGMTLCESEKQDKRRANRMLRRIVKGMVRPGTEILPEMREVYNVWKGGKDGKQYYPSDDYQYYGK